MAKTSLIWILFSLLFQDTKSLHPRWLYQCSCHPSIKLPNCQNTPNEHGLGRTVCPPRMGWAAALLVPAIFYSAKPWPADCSWSRMVFWDSDSPWTNFSNVQPCLFKPFRVQGRGFSWWRISHVDSWTEWDMLSSHCSGL